MFQQDKFGIGGILGHEAFKIRSIRDKEKQIFQALRFIYIHNTLPKCLYRTKTLFVTVNSCKKAKACQLIK